jgi:hypothetical protein
MKHPIDNLRFESRLDKMVQAGRVSEEEAARLRAADPATRGEMIRQIQLRHAGARLEEEVRAGRATSGDADDILARLAKGESPRILGRLRRKNR